MSTRNQLELPFYVFYHSVLNASRCHKQGWSFGYPSSSVCVHPWGGVFPLAQTFRVADQLVPQKIVAPMQGSVTLGFTFITSLSCGSGSSVGIATEYGLDGPGIESPWGEGARFIARRDRPWGPPILLYNGYWAFPGAKVRPGRAADHSPPSSVEVLEE